MEQVNIDRTMALEDEIDLRRYVDVLARRWKFVVGITALMVIVAAVLSFFILPPVYNATAGVIILRSRAEISFDPKFKTESQQGQDPTARRAALTGLVKSSSLAAEVIMALGDSLSVEERQASTLLDQIKVSSQGDLIEITASAGTPQKAAAIANAWAEAYISQVNELYSGVAQSPAQIKAQATAAWQTYQQAQQALEQFLGENRIAELEQQVKSKQATLADNYVTLNRLDRIIGDAQALHTRLRQGAGTSNSNALSLLLLRMNAFGVSSNLPSSEPSERLLPQQPQLQIAIGSASDAGDSINQQTQEVEAVLSNLESRRKEIQARLGTPELQQELAKLQQALEREQARARELRNNRDLAWETYNTLSRKEAEVNVASQVTDNEVKLAVRASEPERPSAPKKAQNTAVAGLLGLVVGVFGAFVLEYAAGKQQR